MATILITGGTGLVGSAITDQLLMKGYKIIILTRKVRKSENPQVHYAHWDVEKQVMDESVFREADGIIHLAGAGIADKRWSAKRKREIRDSRVKSGELLMRKLKDVPNRVRVFVSASATGWYSADPSIPNPSPFREDEPSNDEFLGVTCREWEASVAAVTERGIRLVILRTGIVLSDKGGALPKFRSSITGPIVPVPGGGRQIISWIDLEDLVRMYQFAIEDDAVNGIYNAVSPSPVSLRELMLSLKGNSRKVPVSIPAWVLRMFIGEMSVEVLKSQTVGCEKICSAGFVFHFPDLKDALKKYP